MTAAPVAEVSARAFTIPTDQPESDGTLEWDSTTLVVANVRAGEATGLGWTYGHRATAAVIGTELAGAVVGRDALDLPGAWAAMVAAIRNDGRPGICGMAISALDVALWDLKAKLLAVPLATLLGRCRDAVPIYGSGGFTSYDDDRLQAQLGGWVEQGIGAVKMKIGRRPDRDGHRVRLARQAIGPDAKLFVDANGAYRPGDALAVAHRLAEHDISWLEEPVSSDDLPGLRAVREHAPAGVAVAAGEYGYDLVYFERMLAAEAVDVLQADVTRCGGITELLRIDALCRARSRPLSLHCSPTIHANAGSALSSLEHLEYFHDHARIEELLFEGAPRPRGGSLPANTERPGLGVALRERDAERFAV